MTLEEMSRIAGAASSYAKAANVKSKLLMSLRGVPLCDHREKCGNDVTLYCTVFNDFAKMCKSIDVDRNDCETAWTVCHHMCKIDTYRCEKDRGKVFSGLLESYIGEAIQPYANVDLSRQRGSKIEVKHEVGSGSCDTYHQLTVYYLQDSIHGGSKRTSCPVFLIELVGPHLIISGAVYGQHVYVDRLTDPVWLVPQPQDVPAMMQITRTLKSLKLCIPKLEDYYEQPLPLSNPRFPAFDTFEQPTGTCKIQYLSEIKPYLFRGRVNMNPVVIKFPKRYCIEAHQLLADNKFAPKVLHFNDAATERFKMVVMEEVEGALPIHEYLLGHPEESNALVEQCRQVLSILHASNYCHGDFRSSNILVRGGKISIIDFDWAGKENEVRYPHFRNHVEIQWPDQASDNLLIKKEHDNFWLSQIVINK